MIDKNKIAELRRLEVEATPGEWEATEAEPNDGTSLVVGGKVSDLRLIADCQIRQDAALIVAMRNALPELLKALEWQPIETAPFNRPVDLWCTYPDAPATWGNGLPAGEIVHGRHKTEEYGWFGNQSNDGVPRGDGPDIIPVAWREPAPRIPIEMMEAFVASLPPHGGVDVG